MFEFFLRSFTGDDIFISYSRRDGGGYATALANQLIDRHFTCKFDQWGTPPGHEIPNPLKKALKRSAALILIGTKGASESEAVLQEVKEFKQTGRPIIPILFDRIVTKAGECRDGALMEVCPTNAEPLAKWADDIFGLPMALERPDALKNEEPSQKILSRIEKTCVFWRKDQRQRLATVGAGLLVGLSLLIASGVGYYARGKVREARAASEEATHQQTLAKEQRVIADIEKQKAEDARQEATKSKEEAKLQAILADKAKSRADAQTKIAEAASWRARDATVKAKYQEANAHRNRAVGYYIQSQIEAKNNPRQAIVWASEAAEEAPASDPQRAIYGLRATQLATVIPKFIVNTPSTVRKAIFCDGCDKVAVMKAAGGVFLWDRKTGKQIGQPLETGWGTEEPSFSLGGKWLAALSLDPNGTKAPSTNVPSYDLKVWETETGQLQQRIQGFWKTLPEGLAFSATGNEIIAFGGTLVLESESETIHVWDRASGAPIRFIEPFQFGSARSLRLPLFGGNLIGPLSREPSRNWFLNIASTSQGDFHTVAEIRDVPTGRLIKRFPQRGQILFADFSPDAKKLVTVAVNDKVEELRIWDIDSGQSTEPVTRPLPPIDALQSLAKSHYDIFKIQDISADGSMLLFAAEGSTGDAEIWYFGNGTRQVAKLTSHLQGKEERLVRASLPPIFSRDGRFVIEGLSSPETRQILNEIRVWGTDNGSLVAINKSTARDIDVFLSSSDLTLNISLWDGTLLTSDLISDGMNVAQPRLLRESDVLHAAAVSPTGKEILALSYTPEFKGETRMQLFDLASGFPKWPMDVPLHVSENMSPITFSPGGDRFLISTSVANQATKAFEWWVYRSSDGKVLPGFKPIRGPFNIQFGRAGLIGASYESGRFKVTKWNASSGEFVQDLTSEKDLDAPLFLGFTRFGDYYFTAVLGNAQTISVRSVGAERARVDLHFAASGMSALAVALLRRAREVRITNTGVQLVMDAGNAMSISASQTESIITDDKTRTQRMFPLESGLGTVTGTRIEDISADGTLLAVLLNGADVQIWETRSGQPISEPLWYDQSLKIVSFTPSENCQLLTVLTTGDRRCGFVGDPERALSSWMKGRFGEALSGLRLVNGTQIQRIPQAEYLQLRQRYAELLRESRDAGNPEAAMILRNWRP
jgi:WD40 repeat protein